MRFTVTWLPRPLARLTNIYNYALDKQAVRVASDRIDLALKTDPESKGTPLGKFFVREDAPLAVLYYVAVDDRTVWVVEVKKI